MCEHCERDFVYCPYCGRKLDEPHYPWYETYPPYQPAWIGGPNSYTAVKPGVYSDSTGNFMLAID